MDNAIIYGCGANCRKILSESLVDEYSILYVVDRDSSKWTSHNNELGDLAVRNPADLENEDYDYIIVSIDDWKGAVDDLVQVYHVSPNRIKVYSRFKKRVFDFEEKNNEYYFARYAGIDAERTIAFGLLFENLRNNEFANYKKVYVVGKKVDYQWIHAFFKIFKPEIEVVYAKKRITKLEHYTKYIITIEEYKDFTTDLSCIIRKQILILPFWDIKNNMRYL